MMTLSKNLLTLFKRTPVLLDVYDSWESLAPWVLLLEQESY